MKVACIACMDQPGRHPTRGHMDQDMLVPLLAIRARHQRCGGLVALARSMHSCTGAWGPCRHSGAVALGPAGRSLMCCRVRRRSCDAYCPSLPRPLTLHCSLSLSYWACGVSMQTMLVCPIHPILCGGRCTDAARGPRALRPADSSPFTLPSHLGERRRRVAMWAWHGQGALQPAGVVEGPAGATGTGAGREGRVPS